MAIIHRLYSGDDGFSHFETRELDFTPEGADWGTGVEILGVGGLMLREPPLGAIADFHSPPRRQFVLQLQGSMRIDCGNGEVRVIGPGDILFGDDLTGKGHHSTELTGPRLQAIVYMPEDIDIDAISRVID